MNVSFKETLKQFDHSKAAFKLDDAHLHVDCAKCHVTKVWKGLKFALCTDCHRSPHRQPFAPASCKSCHSTETWKTTKFDHARFGYPLKGLHLTVPCASCHVLPPLKVVLAFDRCATCHQDPHKGAFKQDCASCHTESGFKRATGFDHSTSTKFPLTGKHAALACAKCHKNAPATLEGKAQPKIKVVDFRGLLTTCVTCHADVHRGQLAQTCETCHTTTSFRLPEFKHPRFPEFFAGQHQAVPCASCHVVQAPGAPRQPKAPVKDWTVKDLSIACATCHKDVHLGQFGTTCEGCHTVDAPKFAPNKFSHATTAFPLTGKHQGVACVKCHKTETGAFPTGPGAAVRLKGVSTACASCHEDKHQGQLGSKCETCHTTSAFTMTSYKHKNMNDFFVGVHATKPCLACHKPESGTYPSGPGRTIRYKWDDMTCANCHADPHRGSMSLSCDSCHTSLSWSTISRAFHKTGVFPLEGRHLTVPCASCHVNGVLKGTPSQCESCHWERRQDDPYRARLGMQCGQCHRPISWAAVNWNHAAMTGVVLTPVHRALGCDGCHKQKIFTQGSVFCVTCHQGDYDRTTSPAHRSAGFPTTCETCHLTTHIWWSQATFNHNAFFPLVGIHATQVCAACHRNNIYTGTPRDCYGCHQAQYNATTNPNHRAAGFPTTCESCHNPTSPSWNASFNHNSVFPLVGVHATIACSSCHVNNVFPGTPTTCFGCHQAQYNATTNPNHRAAGFSTSCEQCHNPASAGWGGAFNHSSIFPLVGVHGTIPCGSCHVNGVFRGTPRDCFGCHQAQYNATTNPNHRAAGFPTTCDSCHNPASPNWNASFDHNVFFPLLGRHLTAACSRCHVNNVYQGTPRICYACHVAQYNATTNPNHVAAGFPTTCETCHRASDSSFSQGTFNHVWFPITSGRHAGISCNICHTNSGNYAVFSCMNGCHAKSSTDSNHRGVNGYRYDAAACYSCHPNGRAG